MPALAWPVPLLSDDTSLRKTSERKEEVPAALTFAITPIPPTWTSLSLSRAAAAWAGYGRFITVEALWVGNYDSQPAAQAQVQCLCKSRHGIDN